jgi:hypothetical protein
MYFQFDLPVQGGHGSASHSHSMISRHGNALIPRHKLSPHTTKNRLPDPSETCDLESKGQFLRFGIFSVSAPIGIDRTIFRYL